MTNYIVIPEELYDSIMSLLDDLDAPDMDSFRRAIRRASDLRERLQQEASDADEYAEGWARDNPQEREPSRADWP